MNTNLTINSPGRINLIGEHIDYNGGFVMPAAIGHTIQLSLSKNATKTCNIKSEDYKSGFSVKLESLERSNFQWHNYILGVINEVLQLKAEELQGFDCTIKSSLPMGSGISSSAALECGLAKGLNELFDLHLSDSQIIELSQKAEHNFVGTKCGIMDQFAVVMGKRDKFIKLDCRNLEYNYIDVDLGEYQLILLNTNVSHNLASSGYNRRREECTKALTFINQGKARYHHLCDVSLATLESFKGRIPNTIYHRALYVLQENQRVHMAARAIEQGSMEKLGECLYRSHEGLRNLYEVSCDELDFMVDFSKNRPEVLGSRMMGGGFGGCTINLVHGDALDDYLKKISLAYYNKFSTELSPILITIGDGVKIVKNKQ